MPRLILAAALVLAACAPVSPPGFRDPILGLHSIAAFEPSRIAGHWTQVATFAAPNAPDCTPGSAVFTPAGDGFAVTARLCLGGRTQPISGQLAIAPAGRMQLSGADPAGIGQPWWVIWVDSDYRTLVIGTPSGGFGFILNRTATLPQDRLIAARDILDWSGYDTSRLRLLK